MKSEGIRLASLRGGSDSPQASARSASDWRVYGGLALVTLGVIVLRLPSFFEPPWNTDEGIFAAVAQRVIEGGKLYQDAWESKPPLFLYLYVGILKVFGPGVFGLRLAATVSAAGTHIALFFIARRFVGDRRALLATALCGFFLGVPFWEGTLALTEIFTVLPSTLGVLMLLIWDERAGRQLSKVDALLVLAGALFGAAFLLRQTAIAAGAASGIWLLLRGRPWRRAAVFGGLGFALCIAPVLAAFQLTGDFHWFWDANVNFFFKYVPSGQQLPFATRPVIILPFLITAGALLFARHKGAETPRWSLAGLWLTLTLAGALLTGRAYSHYFLQMFPPLSILVVGALPSADIHWRPSPRYLSAFLLVGALAIEWVYVVVPMFRGNPFAMHWTRGPSYYQNFLEYAAGARSRDAYDGYFDKRVAYTRSLGLALRALHADGEKVYIWGEYPWVYPLAEVEPATRYMTSFYVLLLPYLDVRLDGALNAEKPRYIVVMSDAKPKMNPPSPMIDQRWNNATRRLDAVLARDYQFVSAVGRASIYRRSPEHLNSGLSVGPLPDVPDVP